MDIKVAELVGARALTLEDGNRLHDLILPPLKTSTGVRLDFQGVTDVSTAFLNTAVGQLYAEVPASDLREFLKIENLSESAERSLEKVLTYARRFYRVDVQEA